MQRLKNAARAGLVVLVSGCAADAGSPLEPTAGPAATIVDAAHAGTVPGFYFLPPMVPQPAYSGTFDPGVQPRVEVCELAGSDCATVIAEWTLASGVTVSASSEQYQVNWHARDYDLDPAKHYRISVFVGSFRLGYADVDVVGSGRDLKNVDTEEFVALLDNRTLPIKFRIETGIVGTVVVSPDSAEVAVGGTQQFTATVLDLHGNPMAAQPVAWTSADVAVATVDGSGLATGVSVGSTTVTATAQAASGTAVVVVFNPNQPPVAEPDTFDAIGNFTVPVSEPGVLANDTDPDANPLSAVAGTFPTAQGGTFTLAADGSFTYLSAAGFTGEDEVAYEVTDGIATASSTVTFVVPTRVWYVSNAGDAPGDGRDASPFTTLSGAEAASAAGETIFVLAGDGTSAGLDEGIVLKDGQSLTGQGVSASVTASLNGETVVLLAAGSAPSLTRSDAGPTISLAQDNTVQGLDVASTAGAGIAGSGFGTLMAGSLSVSATGGPSLDLANGTAAASFDALSSAGSAGAGLRLVGVDGVLSAPAGSIAGAAGTGVEVIGGVADVTYGGDVASVGPRPVSVTGRPGGTLTLGGTIASTGQGILVQGNGGGTIAFTGAAKSLATGASHGVELASNAGATVQFAGGGLAVATTTGEAFRATGGGTVTVTGAGNTLSAAGGVALRVESTTVGAAGLTFRSISATGGTNGIVLENTGAVNGMQVTGTGAPGSGGTIQGTSGDGVRLDDVRNVSLSSMAIESNLGSGIAGTSVTGFALDGASVVDNGDDAGAEEAGVRFDGLFGTSSIAQSEVAGSIRDNVRIVNATGSLTLSVDGTTLRDNDSGPSGGDGLRLSATGGAQMTVDVAGSHLLRNRVTGISATTVGNGVLHLGVSGGSLQDNSVGVNLVHGSSGALTFAVDGIPVITGHASSPINVNRLATAGPASTFQGSITGNVIGQGGTTNSGATSGSGVRIVSNGVGGTLTVAVTGNTIREVAEFGVQILARDGSSTINATVTDNDIALTSAFALDGIRVEAGALSTDAVTVCATVAGNTATAPSRGVRLRQRFAGTTFQLAGYGGAPNDNAAVAAFIAATNTVSSASADHGGAGFVGSGSCPTP